MKIKIIISVLAYCLIDHAAFCMEGTSTGNCPNLSVIVETSDNHYLKFSASYVAHLPKLRALADATHTYADYIQTYEIVNGGQVESKKVKHKNIPMLQVPCPLKTACTIKSLIKCLKQHGFLDTASTDADEWPAQAVIAGKLEREIEYTPKHFSELITFIKATDFMGNKAMAAVGCRQRFAFENPPKIDQKIIDGALKTLPQHLLQIESSSVSYPAQHNQWDIPDIVSPEAFHYHNNIMSICTKEAIQAFSLDQQKGQLERLSVHKSKIEKTNYAFSPNGQYSVYSGSHHTLPDPFLIIRHNQSNRIVNDITPDEAYTIDDSGVLYVVSKHRGILKKRLDENYTILQGPNSSAIGKNIISKLLCCTADGSLLAWGQKAGVKVYDTQQGEVVALLPHKNLKHLSIVDRFLVSLGTSGVRVWNVKKGMFLLYREALYTIDAPNMDAAALHAREGYMAMLGGGAIRFMDLRSGVLFLKVDINNQPFKRLSCDQATGSFATITDLGLCLFTSKTYRDQKDTQSDSKFVRD